MGQDPKFTNAFWIHLFKMVDTKTRVKHGFPLSNGWKNGAFEWSLEAILKELGGCGPTRLDGLCGSSGI